MNIYDDLIQEAMGLTAGTGLTAMSLAAGSLWQSEEEQRLIFQRDMAYELGGSGLPAVSALAYTSRPAAGGQAAAV